MTRQLKGISMNNTWMHSITPNTHLYSPFLPLALVKMPKVFCVWIGLEREGWGFWCSQCVYEDLFDNTANLSHMFCAKLFPFHLYRWVQGEAFHLPIKTNILGVSQFYFSFCDGLIKRTHYTRKRKKKLNLETPPSN